MHLSSKFICYSLLLLLSTTLFATDIENFVVYYSDKAQQSDFNKYSLIVFDSDSHPPLEALKEQGKIILGYISIGEIEKSRWYFKQFDNDKILIKENADWKDSYYIDIRNKKWISFVVEELVPRLLNKKFSGVFLDTLDDSIELERKYPKRFKGMKKAAARMVKAIRLNYPQIKIMLNRAYEILPEVENDIDYELGESIYTDYDFKTKKYYFVNKKLYEEQVTVLKKAKKNNPKLQIFTLDYWDPNQNKTIEKIYNIERKNGFIPYVSTVDLNKIIEEPKTSGAETKIESSPRKK